MNASVPSSRRQRRIVRSKMRSLDRRAPIIDLRSHKLGDLPTTGKILEGCYARSLGSCGGKMSREHPISENILKQIGCISRKGIPWLANTEGDDLPSKALAVRTLCQTHNSYLAPLDILGGQIFKEIKDYGQERPRKVLIPGPQFERFILKMLFGLLSTEKFTFGDRVLTTADLEPCWLNILFGLETMPNGVGLFISYVPGMKIQFKSMVSAALVCLDGNVGGIRLDFAGVRFLFSLFPKEKAFRPDHPQSKWVLNRPKAINKDPYPQSISFEWPKSKMVESLSL